MSRIVLVTGHVFGCRALEGLMSSDAISRGELTVSLVVGLSAGRADRTVGFQSPGALAQQLRAPFLETMDGRLTTLLDELRAAEPDYLLVIGWSTLVPPEVLSTAKKLIDGLPGAVGMHPTMLPVGRGCAPIPWTIINGLRTTALSAFVLRDVADSGPLVAQWPITVAEPETSRSLFWKFADLHYHAGAQLAGVLVSHDWRSRRQEDASATTWPKRSEKDGAITRSMTREQVGRLVRAQQPPYPLAWLVIDGRKEAVAACRLRAPGMGSEWRAFEARDGRVWLQLLGH